MFLSKYCYPPPTLLPSGLPMNGGEGFLSVSEPRSGSQSRHQDLGRPEPSKKKWQLRNTAQSILIQKPLGQRWRVEGTIFTLLDGQPSTSTPPDNRAGHKSENFGRVIVPCSFFTDTSQVTVFFLPFYTCSIFFVIIFQTSHKNCYCIINCQLLNLFQRRHG